MLRILLRFLDAGIYMLLLVEMRDEETAAGKTIANA